MSSRPWMPLYVNDFLTDTLELKSDEIGVYLILLMLMWRRDDAALPDDSEWIKRTLKVCIADFHGHQFNRIVPKLLGRYFDLGPDRKWHNKRLTLEREKTAKRSANAQQMAFKRHRGSNGFNGLGHAKAVLLTTTIESSTFSESETGLKALKESANMKIETSSLLATVLKRKGWT
jgi:uncharacterized protein YdaU (DUF1376 family)